MPSKNIERTDRRTWRKTGRMTGVNRPLLFCVAPLAALCITDAAAQGAFDLGEITAFANLTPTEVNRTGATVDVVTEEEMRAEGTQLLSSFLARRPGISVTSSGGPGSATTMRVRGLDSKYIAVRIDGIDVTDPSAPQIQYDFGKLTTADVSRVEIVYGTQSALYGSSAVAGVINITTTRATEPGTTLRAEVEGGSYGTIGGSLGVTTVTDRSNLAFTLSHFQTDGFSAASEANGNTEPDGYETTRLSFFGSYDVTDDLRLGLNGFWQEYSGDTDGFDFGTGLPADGPFLTEGEDGTARGLRAFAEYSPGAIDHSIALAYYDNDRTNDIGFGTSSFLGERTTLEYLGTTSILNGSTLSFGAVFSEERFDTSDSFGGAASGDRQVGAVFAEGQFALSPATDLAVSLRYDDYSDFGDFVSGRLALAYRPADGTTLRAVLSNGFRAPSLFEINDPTYGNASLTPEESRTFELGVEQRFSGGATLQATAFWTDIDDLIQFIFPAGYVQTTGTTETRGVSLSGSLPLGSRAELFGNYTYTDANAPDGSQLVRVPKNDLSLGVSGDITDRLRGVATAQFVSGVEDIGGPLDDYWVANATLTYEISETTETYLRVVNIFDEDYEVIEGYGTSGRAFYVGLRARF
jgi:vitamin B12 transporter